MSITTAVINELSNSGFIGVKGIPGVPGLQVSFRKSGKSTTVTFLYRYKSPLTGKSATLTIGRHGTGHAQFTLSSAKDRASNLRLEVKQGVDPAKRDGISAEKVDRPAKRVDGMTIDEFVNIMVEIKKRSGIAVKYANTMTSHANELKKAHGSLLVRDLTRSIAGAYIASKVEKWIDANGRERGGYRAAGLAKASLSSLWTSAIYPDEEHPLPEDVPEIEYNPWVVSKTLSNKIKAGVKEQYLDADDLYPLFKKLPDIDSHIARAVLIMLYSGVRPNEATMLDEGISGIDWSEIRWRQGQWRIPKHRMKKRRIHIVPISDQFMRLLRAWHLEDGNPETGAICRTRCSEAPIKVEYFDKAMKQCKLGFTPHVIRKTVYTMMQEMDCPTDINELIAAHKPQGVGIHYNFSMKLRSRGEWLQKWADELDKINEGNLVDQIIGEEHKLSIVTS